jgi:hypothetical protein
MANVVVTRQLKEVAKSLVSMAPAAFALKAVFFAKLLKHVARPIGNAAALIVDFHFHALIKFLVLLLIAECCAVLAGSPDVHAAKL